MRKLFFFLLVFSAASPVFAGETLKEIRQERRDARKEFNEQLKKEKKDYYAALDEKSPEERRALAAKRREETQARREAFRNDQKAMYLDALKKKFEANPNLTDAQRAEMLKKIEARYDERKAVFTKRTEEDKAFWKQLAADKTLTPEQRKAKGLEYIAARKKAAAESAAPPAA